MTGRIARALTGIADDLYPYLMRYGTQQISELDARPLSELRRYADGIGRILDIENGG